MFKKTLIKKILALVPQLAEIKILELGCGEALQIFSILEEGENLKYVGIEPKKKEASRAVLNLAKFNKAKIINALAYNSEDKETFDICFSLSVLEHVKDLPQFIKNSIEKTKSGGLIVHSYDLGHALHPSSLKEKLHVFLGNHLPWLLSEMNFVNYVDREKVREMIEKNGAEVFKITYHQMPDHKKFLKYLSADNPVEKQIAEQLIEWEFAAAGVVDKFSQRLAEQLFPTICIWARKL